MMETRELITEILKLTGHKRSLHPDVNFGIQRLLKKYEDKWISVEDSLPEMMDWVLFYDPERQKVDYGCAMPDGIHKGGSVYPGTHWMPLPNPPKQENK